MKNHLNSLPISGILAGLLLLTPAQADDSGLCPVAGPLMADLATAMMAQVVPLDDALAISLRDDGWVQDSAVPLASPPAWQILTALTDSQFGGMVLPDRWAGFGQSPAVAGREWPCLFDPAPVSTDPVEAETRLALALLPRHQVTSVLLVIAVGAENGEIGEPVTGCRLSMLRSEVFWKNRARDSALRPQFQRLMPRLRKVFEAEGVPEKWVWVAEVESTFNPRARSLAGAAGLYQLMPTTARRFGLRTFPFDDRLVPEKNARAAARYLKMLYQQFESWPLALAAYNAGEGRISREMKKRGARTYGEIVRHLPLETQIYVPRVMATAALREDQAAGLPSALAVGRKSIRGAP